MAIKLENTNALWGKIKGVFDGVGVGVKKHQLEKQIKLTKQELEKAESMEEHDALSEKLIALQRKLTAANIDFRTLPKRQQEVRQNELKQLPQVYNEEFKPYYDRYVKLDGELKKKLAKFAKDTESIVKEMNEIEKLEISLHSMKIVGGNEYRDYLSLPVDRSTIRKDLDRRRTKDMSLASDTRKIINQIKKIK